MDKALSDAWDKLTVAVFIGSNSAFYGSLLCSMRVEWDSSIQTACVNPDLGIKWNPDFFKKLPEDTRKFVLLHELEHVARLHELRREHRNHALWNKACDYEINQAQVDDGLTFTGTSPLIDTKYRGMTAEEIYKELEQDNPPDQGSWGDGNMDMDEGTEPTQQQLSNILNTVVKASQTAKMQGCTSARMQAVDSLLSTFLAPKVEWYKVLRNYMTEKFARRLTWRRPNKYYPDFYVPSRQKEDDALAHINFYLDTSGSMSDGMVQITNSEIKYIHSHFKPKKLTVVQFDTSIRHEKTYIRSNRIKEMQVSGRGGTDLVCVRQHIMQSKPKIAVVLSDLDCPVMEPVHGVDILWVVFDNPEAQVNQGKICHVKTF